MGPIPEDLIVFLFFGLFVLVQIVRAQRRKKARRAVPSAAPVEAPVEANEMTPLPMPWIAASVGPDRPLPPARAPHLPLVAAPDRRRFSRRRLLGDRRSLQDAIVVATVLGPCLAQRPRDTE